jgi:protein ImuB
MGLRIRCQHTLSDAKQNADLFVREQGRTDAAQLLNRLQAKLGEQNVQRLRAETNHQPERSVSYQSLQQLAQLVPSTLADKLSETSSRRTSKTLPNNSAFTALRPNILLQQPRVLAEAVRIIHGPERLQSGWWGDEVFCRDYFVARNQQQQLLWVYRDPEQTWFVHGLFA